MTMHSPTLITKESFHSDTVLQLTYSGLPDHLYPAVSGERQLYITLIYGYIKYILKAFDYLVRSQTFHL